MKILVTGNMGYVGPCVVERLREAYDDASLVGFDTGYFAHCLLGGVLPERRIDCQYFGDVRAVPDEVLSGVDAVVHLAAVSNDPIGAAYEEVTLAVNHRATVDLARKAKAAGAKSFVFASSCSMYGFAEEGMRTEASALNPLTAYARSKVFAERDLEPLVEDGFTVTSLRFATACGASPRLRLDLVLNDFVAGAIASRRVALLSDGSPWRPLIHVQDMARAIEWAVSRPASAGGSFLAVNAGSDAWNYQMRDLANAVARVVPDVDVSIPAEAAPDRRSYKVSFELFRRLAPAHQPQVTLDEAIRGLAASLEEIGFADQNFRNSRFARLPVLADLRARGLLTEQLEWARSSNGYRRQAA